MLQSKTVLVVDDDAVFQLSVGRLLSASGATVVYAGNGREAVDGAAAATPDVIVMGVRMPVLDGFQAAALILAERRVPIVFQSADHVEERASELGCAFLNKAHWEQLPTVLASVRRRQAGAGRRGPP